MEQIRKEISNAIELLAIQANEITHTEYINLFGKVCGKYSNDGKYDYPLWENLSDKISVNEPNGWKLIEDLLPEEKVYLLLEKSDGEYAFSFQNGKDISSVLGECFGFVFYITNDKLDFLLSFNDHDYLIACGEAKNWLDRYLKKNQ